MDTLYERAFALVAVVYGMFGLSLIFYTNRVKKQLDRHEAEQKILHSQEILNRSYDSESTHKSDPTQPLLGVVSPPAEEKSKK